MAVSPIDSMVFGTLYGSDQMRAIFDERTLFQNMLDTEAALARVQAKLGIIPQNAANAICEAAHVDNLDMSELAKSVQNVGYPVVGVVKGLSRAAGEDAGKWTHWGATTQDIIDTAIALQIRAGLALLRTDLLATIHALAGQADRHRATVMAGRTHLQHALPITFGLKCAVWLQPLAAHVERLDQLRPRIERVQFGGAAGTLASLGADGIKVLDGLAAELGLAAPPLPWHVSRDGVAEAAGLLGLICGSLSKIAFDIILLAQTEVGEVQEPYIAGRGGSSTMPQKRNPIASEYIIAAGRAVQALVPMMQGAMVLDQERGTGPWQSEPLGLPQMFVLTHGALLHARAIGEGLVVDADRMRKNLDATGGLIMAEAVMMGLAPHMGRDEAHHAVKHACDAALQQGIGLTAALKSEAAVHSRLDEAAVESLTDPINYLGVTDSFIDRALAEVAALC